MIDWATLRADSDPAELKRRLDLPTVAVEAGMDLEDSGDGRLVGLCPFHNDSTPSFAIFGDDLDRWGCWSCSTGGDVLDFIRLRWDLDSFAAVVAKGQEMAGSAIRPASRARCQMLKTLPAVDILAAQKRLEGVIEWLLAPLCARPAWTAQAFGLGELSGALLVPHWDARGQLTGLKLRGLGGRLTSMSGSKLVDLYGAWRHASSEWLMICEGESDTWALSELGYPAVGLPAGAQGPTAAQLEWVGERRVWLVFDADDAGRAAAARWNAALMYTSTIVTLPERMDVRSCVHLLEVMGCRSTF